MRTSTKQIESLVADLAREAGLPAQAWTRADNGHITSNNGALVINAQGLGGKTAYSLAQIEGTAGGERTICYGDGSNDFATKLRRLIKITRERRQNYVALCAIQAELPTAATCWKKLTMLCGEIGTTMCHIDHT